MADDKLFIPLILGTNRKDRESEAPAKWVYSRMQLRDDIEPAYFDVREFVLPQDNYGTEIADLFPEWKDAVTRADGLVIVTPEYNHGYPGILKSVLDLLLKEYIHKAVAFVGVSAGPWGGTRVIEAMLPPHRCALSASTGPSQRMACSDLMRRSANMNTRSRGISFVEIAFGTSTSSPLAL